MPFVEFTALLALATAMSFTPGPNTTLSTAMAANRGLRPAMRFVCSVPVGWSALLLLCAGGVGAVVVAVPALRWAIKAVGIGYLLWLAWKLSQSAQLGEATTAAADDAPARRSYFDAVQSPEADASQVPPQAPVAPAATTVTTTVVEAAATAVAIVSPATAAQAQVPAEPTPSAAVAAAAIANFFIRVTPVF